MKEKKLRQTHRYAGIILALLIFLQTASGIVLSVEDLAGAYFSSFISDVHYGFGYTASILRVILGVGLLWMAISGIMIHNRISARQKR